MKKTNEMTNNEIKAISIDNATDTTIPATTSTVNNKEAAKKIAFKNLAKFNITLDEAEATKIFKKADRGLKNSQPVAEIVDVYIQKAKEAAAVPTEKPLTKKQAELKEAIEKPATDNKKGEAKSKVKIPIRDTLFVKSFTINNLKFTRLDNGLKLPFKYKNSDDKQINYEYQPTEYQKGNRKINDYSEVVASLLMNINKLKNKRIVIAAAYNPNEFIVTKAGKSSRYNRDNAPYTLPDGVEAVPFNLVLIDIEKIYTARNSNSITINATNVYTGAPYTYILDDFTFKTKDGYFKPSDLPFPLELYLVDSTKVNKSDKAFDFSQDAMYIDLTQPLDIKDTSSALQPATK